MHIQELQQEKVFEALGTAPGGLSEPEASRRLLEYGPNRVERIRGAPLWLRFLRQFTHLFALLLWAAAGLSAAAAIRQPGSGMETLAAAILLVILINGSFAFWQEYRSERAIEALQQLLPRNVRVIRDGILREIKADDLVPGDVIALAEGEPAPADCRIVKALGLQVNMAALTGESVPQAKDAKAVPAPGMDMGMSMASSRNILAAGTSIVAGEAEAVIFATGMRTMLGHIAHAAQTAGEQQSPLQREVSRLSRIIALFSLALGLAYFLASLAAGIPLTQALIFAIGLTVANVPEGLLPTVTLALAMASQRLARKNVLVRKLAAVEGLGAATVICTDKTGTLTENKMTVHSLYIDGAMRDASPSSRDDAPGRLLAETASLCQTLSRIEGRLVGDPTEIALAGLAENKETPAPKDGIPFDPDRRRMSLLYETGEESILHLKGALEAVLPLCRFMAGAQGITPMTDAGRNAIQKAEAEMAGNGLRVIALARRTVPQDAPREQWENDLVFLGLAGLFDPPRTEVPEAIARCRGAGIRVIMVTGDHPGTATAIAREIGLVSGAAPRVITGEQLARMPETQLQIALDAPEILFARIQAEQKFHIVKALQAKGEIVAVTGDGVNDAPALRKADIGIAMGASGTEVAREAADIVLLDDNFASIAAAIEEGRTVFDNIRKFLIYVLTSNVAELAPYLAFAVFDVPLALTIAQILAIDLGTDMLPALALAGERPEPDVMNRPPRAKTQRLIGAALLARAYGFLGVMQAAGGMGAFFLTLTAGGWSFYSQQPPDPGLYRQATSVCLATIVVMQMANLFACRSHIHSAFRRMAGGNPAIPYALAAEAALIGAILYTELGNRLFAVAPVSAGAWARAALFALILLLAEEGRKALSRRLSQARR